MIKTIRNNLSIILIVFTGLFLRLFELRTRPFDGDEGIMVLIASNGWKALFERASFDVHPPLYHIFLKLFLNFGTNEWTVRIFSATCGVMIIIGIYYFVCALINKKIGIITSLLVAISPYLIYPSQEARMYSFFALLVFASYYYFHKLLEKKDQKYFIGYIIFSVLMIYTQYLGFIVIFSQFVYLIICKKFLSYAWKWVVSWIIILILFLPQAQTFISQFTGRTGEQTGGYNLLDNIKGVIGAFYRMGSGRIYLDLSPGAIKDLLFSSPVEFIFFTITLIIPLVLIILGIKHLYKKDKEKLFFLATPIIIAIIIGLISSDIGSKASRYFIYIAPFYFIILVIGFNECFAKRWAIVFPIMFAVISVFALYKHYFVEVKAPGVNKIAAYIDANSKENDVVLIRGGFGGGEGWVFDYYNKNKNLKIVDMLGDYKAGNLAQLQSLKSDIKANELETKYNTVWYYDMTYSNPLLKGNKIYLGHDKENKNLILWEITK